MSEKHLSDTKFSSLPLSEDLQKGIQEAGFEYCTPIQALTLPIALQKKDVTGQAQTGTGKTAAFLIAAFQALLDATPDQTADAIEVDSIEGTPADTDATTQQDTTDNAAPDAVAEPAKQSPKTNKQAKSNNPRAIVIAPTRELAIQIYSDAQPLNKYSKLRIGLAYGGTDYEKQRKFLENGCDILVGTPGRIIDYFKQKVFSLNDIQVLILDEADRMFDMGFIKDIRFMLRRMPEPQDRLNMLFSATLSQRVKELAYEHMNSPTELKVESDTVTAEKIKQAAYMPANEEKIPLLMGLLRRQANSKAVVFINTKYKGEEIQLWLEANGFKSGLLSGDVPQRKRESLLKKFKSGDIKTLVATDVAARGLHIDDVDLVINFDLPQDAEDYVHRIGRTARAGASGTAISMICETYGIHMMDIEEYIGHKIESAKDQSEILVTDAIVPEKPAKKTSKKKTSKKRASKKSPNKTPSEQHAKPTKNNASKIEKTKPVSKENDSDNHAGSEGVTKLIRRRKNLREIPAVG